MGTSREERKVEIKQMIIDAVDIPDVEPGQIEDGSPLFGTGNLGLDSIDALEITVALQSKFGVRIDNQNLAVEILQSVDTIANFVEAQREESQ